MDRQRQRETDTDKQTQTDRQIQTDKQTETDKRETDTVRRERINNNTQLVLQILWPSIHEKHLLHFYNIEVAC